MDAPCVLQTNYIMTSSWYHFKHSALLDSEITHKVENYHEIETSIIDLAHS